MYGIVPRFMQCWGLNRAFSAFYTRIVPTELHSQPKSIDYETGFLNRILTEKSEVLEHNAGLDSTVTFKFLAALQLGVTSPIQCLAGQFFLGGGRGVVVRGGGSEKMLFCLGIELTIFQ